MTVLPAERDPTLVVHANAVPPSLLALQPLEPVAGRNKEVFEAPRSIEKLELPLNDSPKLTRNASGSLCVPISEQINGRFVQERLNHDTGYILHDYRVVVHSEPAIHGLCFLVTSARPIRAGMQSISIPSQVRYHRRRRTRAAGGYPSKSWKPAETKSGSKANAVATPRRFITRKLM